MNLKSDIGDTPLRRLRRLCNAMPDCEEKISHGEPTFCTYKRVFAMFSNNHHNDGHVAVWLPAPPGMQQALIDDAPETYYRPPYVGSSGWIGIELETIADDALEVHIREAWDLIAAKARPKKKAPGRASGKARR
jgi:hypothetical protein